MSVLTSTVLKVSHSETPELERDRLKINQTVVFDMGFLYNVPRLYMVIK